MSWVRYGHDPNTAAAAGCPMYALDSQNNKQEANLCIVVFKSSMDGTAFSSSMLNAGNPNQYDTKEKLVKWLLPAFQKFVPPHNPDK